MFVILVVLIAVGFTMAQTYTEGTGGITGVDKLGAHQNGGRGCAGCHAPHSGAFGAGGSSVGVVKDTTNAGNYALWGQDLGPLYGVTINQGDKVTEGGNSFATTLPTSDQFADEPAELSGIMMCLSCHDGNIAKGAMMTNKSYEQAMNLLPTGLYGPNAIPTLLGNDGTAAGNYYNDHPIGPQATLGAVRVASKLVFGTCSFGPCLKDSGADPNFTIFVNHYGLPSITSNGHASPVALPDTTTPGNAYLLCTTCHTPHSMYIASANADAPIHTRTSGTFPTYFFLAAPYNPGSNPTAQQASSATQFCRQCHYTGAGGANEASGITTVTTAF